MPSSSPFPDPPRESSDVYGNSPHFDGDPYYPWIPLPEGYVRFEVRCAVCHKGLCAVSYGVKTHKLPCVFVGPCPVCSRS